MPAHPQPAAMTADQFRALLEAAGLTQQRAAALLGVSVTAVQHWLQGDTPISQAKADLIRARLTSAPK